MSGATARRSLRTLLSKKPKNAAFFSSWGAAVFRDVLKKKSALDVLGEVSRLVSRGATNEWIYRYKWVFCCGGLVRVSFFSFRGRKKKLLYTFTKNGKSRNFIEKHRLEGKTVLPFLPIKRYGRGKNVRPRHITPWQIKVRRFQRWCSFSIGDGV